MSASRTDVVAILHQAPTTQQQTEAQIRNQIQQSTAEIRRTALENARAQIEAQRAQLEAERARLEAQSNARAGAGVVVVPPIPPAIPGESRQITVSRDGQIVVGGAGGAGPAIAQTGDPSGFVFRPEVPHGAVVLGIAFFVMLAFIAVGLPLARAWARRMDRRATAPAPFPSDVADRLERIEHAVESIAIEVERVSEGQRFTTKLLTERGEGATAAAVAAIPAAARPDDYAGGGR